MSDIPNIPVRRRELERDLDKLDRFAVNMDALVRIPGTRLTLGLDSVLGLIPVVGDTLALAPSLYVMIEAKRLGASSHALGRMGFNVGIDWLVGLVPVVGDLFDFGWQANIRNTRILREELGHPKEKAALTDQSGPQ
ncbi:DUF4112 domain-containing protein [uncultured Litoreibacter sp.]|uniref:DUF4112 domain-containing protein n=1 Tax=uncultured Litoreibacter sp. TaxID=1392394 RepID=UPI002636D60C|nr:DUF4112 domain-containing protein [uncultured Litoreibacter sp.]